MKSYILIFVMAMCLVGAPVAQASVSGVEETSMPAKKTTKKKTTKKSTKKASSKTSAKKSSKSTTTPQSTKVVEQPAETKTESEAQQVTEQPSQGSSAGSSLIGGILSSVLGGGSSNSSSSAASSSDNGSGLLSALTSIFDATKGATKNKIVGTWTYTEPAVVFESNNVLKNIGGKVASQTIEKQLQSQFEKFGIKKGMMTMTFDKNGNFTQTVNGKTMSGTYTISKTNVTLKYGGTVQQFVGTTQLDGNSLLIVMDASKLLKYANAIGSLTGNSLLKTAGSLLSSMDGMEVGLKLEK